MNNAASLPANLSDVSNARLPEVYESAQKAIAACAKVDGCKDWADRAAAMASYARQAKDDSLKVMAIRIQARALRRAGELLKQIPASNGGRPSENSGGCPPELTRTQAATDAGLSEHQRKTAIRVASVPVDDFDYAVESQDPPTVTQLAVFGTQPRPPATDGARESGHAKHAQIVEAIKVVHQFAEYCEGANPLDIATSIEPQLAETLRHDVYAIYRWLDRLLANPCK